MMGGGLDPTLLGWYHGRQLEGSRRGEENLKAAKSRTVFVSDVYSGCDRLI